MCDAGRSSQAMGDKLMDSKWIQDQASDVNGWVCGAGKSSQATAWAVIFRAWDG